MPIARYYTDRVNSTIKENRHKEHLPNARHDCCATTVLALLTARGTPRPTYRHGEWAAHGRVLVHCFAAAGVYSAKQLIPPGLVLSVLLLHVSPLLAALNTRQRRCEPLLQHALQLPAHVERPDWVGSGLE